MFTWDDLSYWQSGEWQVCEEKLSDLRKKRIQICPKKENMFAALDAVDIDKVKVCIIGQDPYPDPSFATGFAFSIPSDIERKKWPPSLVNIFTELTNDLGYPEPKSGDLTPWVKQGVLLWNSVPTCTSYVAGSHNWVEYKLLTQEIVETLDQKYSCVFILIGNQARGFNQFIKNCDVIQTGHPSPLAVKNTKAKVPFFGSRLFSTCNSYLTEDGQTAINWRL